MEKFTEGGAHVVPNDTLVKNIVDRIMNDAEIKMQVDRIARLDAELANLREIKEKTEKLAADIDALLADVRGNQRGRVMATERFTPWTPYPVRSVPICLHCGEINRVSTYVNRIDGHVESEYDTCRDCREPVSDEADMCTGCERVQADCDCAAECPCEEKGTLYDWEGHAVMGCPVHPVPQTI